MNEHDDMTERLIAKLRQKFAGTALVEPLTPSQEDYLQEALDGKKPLSLALLAEASAQGANTAEASDVAPSEEPSSPPSLGLEQTVLPPLGIWSLPPSRNLSLARSYGDSDPDASFELSLQAAPASVPPSFEGSLLRLHVKQGQPYEVFHQSSKDAFFYLIELDPNGERRLLKGFLEKKKSVETPEGGALFLFERRFEAAGTFHWLAFYLSHSPWDLDGSLREEATPSEMIALLERVGSSPPPSLGFCLLKKLELHVL